MIKRYRIKSSIENYRASFEMLLEDGRSTGNATLTHLRNLISKYENKYVDAVSFRENFKEIEIVGNTVHDLNTSEFRMFIMGEATCIRFYREERVIDIIPFIEKPTALKDDQEFQEYISQWRDDNVTDYLKLAGLSLTDNKTKRRKKVSA